MAPGSDVSTSASATGRGARVDSDSGHVSSSKRQDRLWLCLAGRRLAKRMKRKQLLVEEEKEEEQICAVLYSMSESAPLPDGRRRHRGPIQVFGKFDAFPKDGHRQCDMTL